MRNFKDYSIRIKLVIIFILFKVIPLLVLAYIGIQSFLNIDQFLQTSSSTMIKKSQESMKKTTYLAINNSIKALDEKSKTTLEDKAVSIALDIADFLYGRDQDILFLSKLPLDQTTIQNFYASKKRAVIVPALYIYDEKKGWIPKKEPQNSKVSRSTTLKDNQREFHKVEKISHTTQQIPIYKEVSFYLPDGREIYKISSIDSHLYNISDKKNTYLKAEDYYKKAKLLKKGEIYVSDVIGEYLPSPVIGSFTKETAKKHNIPFQPQKYAYAGRENPVGKKFTGIIRFVTPVYKAEKKIGYLTLALDHHHIMNFTDFTDPFSPQKLPIADAANGNYAFLWNNNFECISHPRDYFIIGYDKKSGRKVPGWIDTELAAKFKESQEKDLATFLKTEPIFDHQSLAKKPNLAQLALGEIGLDCRYLNFAPQCEGWSELVNDGGYGSFIIFWSKVWKLTVAATIPYYTGDYGKTKRGFGFVTIGANVARFHEAATQTKEKIESILGHQYNALADNIQMVSAKIYDKVKQEIHHMTIATLILIVIVLYVAFWLARYITNKINSIIIATKKLKDEDFSYTIHYQGNDEFAQLVASFNDMAHSINKLNKDLRIKIYKDELTSLANRNAFSEDITEDVTLVLIDIDDFKTINDFYGGDTGNTVLIAFADLIEQFFKPYLNTAYRIGSDDFVVSFNEIMSHKKITHIVEEFNQYIKAEEIFIEYLDLRLHISCTCGIAIGGSSLLEKADMALNIAKKTQQHLLVYDETDPRMNRQTEFILWKDKLTYAIEHDGIVPFFQPIISLKDARHKKFEVLMRLKDGEQYISPVIFMDIAKKAKLYTQLTHIMIEKSCEAFKDNDYTFSVNLSYLDVIDTKTVDFIEECIKRYNVGHRIIFEILETEEIKEYASLFQFIEKMRYYGVRIAIDDFGSGYSNFTSFSTIHPDFLKIDGSIIKQLPYDSTHYHIVNAIVKFAKSLDIKLIAEYVSTKEIYEILKQFDIDFVQGYYLGEPTGKLS